MSHTSTEPVVSPPPLVRHAGPRSVNAPSPARNVGGGVIETAVPVLRLTDIGLSFDGIQALSGIDFTVAPGEARAIIGPNDAGKGSLVNIISSLCRSDRGGIWLSGRAAYKVLPAGLTGLGIARTFQNLVLLKDLRVRDNITLGRVQHTRLVFVEQLIGLGRARRELVDARERAEQMIHFVDLTEVQNQLAGTLPCGLQKHIELARALVARPHLLLLDEPLAGMTVTEKVQMADLTHVTRDQWGTTIVLIEHGIGLVLGLSDRVAVLDYGRKIANGMPQTVRDDPVIIDAYLDVAHTTVDVAEIQ